MTLFPIQVLFLIACYLPPSSQSLVLSFQLRRIPGQRDNFELLSPREPTHPILHGHKAGEQSWVCWPSKPGLLNLGCTLESPGEFKRFLMLGPYPRPNQSESLGWDPGFGISESFPGNANMQPQLKNSLTLVLSSSGVNQNHLEDLLKLKLPGPSQVFSSSGMGPKDYISNEFPGAAPAGPHFENRCSSWPHSSLTQSCRYYWAPKTLCISLLCHPSLMRALPP